MRRLHLGTDGPATFTARHTRVAIRLKAANTHMVHVHCVAHREALAAADACQIIANLKDVSQPPLRGVFNFKALLEVYNGRMQASSSFTTKRNDFHRYVKICQPKSAINSLMGAKCALRQSISISVLCCACILLYSPDHRHPITR